MTIITAGGDSSGAATGSPSDVPGGRKRLSLRWIGLVPLLAFLFVFLLLPAWGVIQRGMTDADSGGVSWHALIDSLVANRRAFSRSLWLSVISALLGTIAGTAVAYAAATATRPRWLRSVVSAFSGVAANMGGVILAFLFFTLLGRQGLATKLLNEVLGLDLYASSWFSLNDMSGWVTVYLYFQIPLMMLVMLPAVDGLRPAWREASANLGGTTWTYWWRVGLPVLMPSILGGFLLLFANAFSAYATVYALNNQANVVPVKISSALQSDVGDVTSTPYTLATGMIVVVSVAMAGYFLLRRRAERWQAV